MRKDLGFTLLEILIAITIFAILATMTSSIIYHTFTTQTIVKRQTKKLSQIQVAIALIQRDTQQIIARSIRNSPSHEYPRLVGKTHYLEFTRGGNIDPAGNPKISSLTRIAYLCQSDQLIRRSWSHLDTPNRQQHEDLVLLTHLNQCHFAYLTHRNEIVSQWQEITLNQRRESLPSAIQYTFDIKDKGTMSLLFIIPEALYAP